MRIGNRWTFGAQSGHESIVSKREGSAYRSGESRDWLKTKVSETGAFVITGYIEREAVAVFELKDGVLVPTGLVKFGLAGKEALAAARPAARWPAAAIGHSPGAP